MSNDKDIKFAERTRPSPGDIEKPKAPEAPSADPATPAPKQENISFKRFPNGMVFGFSVNPRKAGTFVIHDATGTPFAIALHPGIADLICQAVTFFFVKQDEVRAQQSAAVDSLTDAANASEAIANDASHPAGQPDENKPFVPIAAPDLKVVATGEANPERTAQ